MKETAVRPSSIAPAILVPILIAGWVTPSPGADVLEKFTPHHVAKVRAVTSARDLAGRLEDRLRPERPEAAEC